MRENKTAEIWKDFGDQLKRWILSKVNNEQVASDLLQDVFVKIHLNLSSLKNEDRLASWVFLIARNTVNDYYRSKDKSSSLEYPITEDLDHSSENTSDALHVIDCLRPFISSLPEKYKKAIILSELKGIPQKEVGDRLGLSESGAKSRIQRGRELIKQHFITCCNFSENASGKLIGEHSHDCRPNAQST